MKHQLQELDLHQEQQHQQHQQQQLQHQQQQQRQPEENFIEHSDSLNSALQLITRALNIQDEPMLTMETLQAYVLDLKLKEKAQQAAYPKVQLVHRVLKQIQDPDREKEMHMYLDQPMWLGGATSHREALAGNLPLQSTSSYLSKRPEVCCLIYRDYDVTYINRMEVLDEDHDQPVKPKHTAETVALVTASLTTAVAKFLKYYSFNTPDDVTVESVEFSGLCIAIYHARGDALIPFLETLEGEQRDQLQVLLNFFISQYEDEYSLVDHMTRRGIITQEYIKYLFKPGEVIVKDHDQDARGYLSMSWLKDIDTADKSDRSSSQTKTKKAFSMKAWSWELDSGFSREAKNLILQFDTKDSPERKISDMNFRPLRYVDEQTQTRLKARGEWFWKCRVRRMVCYDDTQNSQYYSGDERYMVDMMIYHELHKPDFFMRRPLIDSEALKQENPPDENFLYLSPLTVKAYNLKRKKWVDLKLDGLREISWNKQAFESLVLKEKTKRLIRALVSNQIEAEKSTDLISGKGNGLIMLLHGGPGTGKTLTAESVAEIAKRPLYPVTCGDIGTKPEDVERYLESVLYLGKTWGCVVLLDEADVFLEQRSLEDLHRNALVSVFLRVLEYYDGILILTSNRVGTFDEAFKSRIQLAVHYNSLDLDQRTQIWRNFTRRLKDLNEEGIDFADLMDNIPQLARKEMNGREIRNAITTARQYARWERQQDHSFKLDYKVMKEVIETAGEFDDYINTLNGGFTQEQLAKDEGIR
ncbi:ATPase family associated with various cellular activities (AAA) domain-containing protein [Trichoderma breve]|uniref:ATPase family associated with various cellular activities (AAA) domain-containing protein n=1 Tax=Trichoderma breve TaxID=2034170 RepID=A0A9W9B974_9HYPO|nr:ATPase family associated with various cellular activities (AAA) domain-containing protein [Trichoderma breve]KAJ4858272.1 ATPase family associated with various cellular activities (AAA) domain-containing protein [Trichoderma breve]